MFLPTHVYILKMQTRNVSHLPLSPSLLLVNTVLQTSTVLFFLPLDGQVKYLWVFLTSGWPKCSKTWSFLESSQGGGEELCNIPPLQFESMITLHGRCRGFECWCKKILLKPIKKYTTALVYESMVTRYKKNRHKNYLICIFFTYFYICVGHGCISCLFLPLFPHFFPPALHCPASICCNDWSLMSLTGHNFTPLRLFMCYPHDWVMAKDENESLTA